MGQTLKVVMEYTIYSNDITKCEKKQKAEISTITAKDL